MSVIPKENFYNITPELLNNFGVRDVSKIKDIFIDEDPIRQVYSIKILFFDNTVQRLYTTREALIGYNTPSISSKNKYREPFWEDNVDNSIKTMSDTISYIWDNNIKI